MEREFIRNIDTLFPSGISCSQIDSTNIIRVEFIEAFQIDEKQIIKIMGAYALPRNLAEELRKELNEILGEKNK